ncbi:MAG: hypothetical protein II347_03095 [Lachnospiraceae bacterium]|nr:hypothetical protein [Lachnospiraceae bacterium]
MTLSYDAYLMQQLVAACQTANDEILKAQQLITSVKSHADWTCKEKSVIDELMEECKKLINRMQDDENSFLNVLKEVEGELDGAEKSISSLFQGVESILAKVLSIPAGVVTTVGTGLLGAAGGALGNMFGGMGDAVSGIADQMIDQFNPDHVGTGGWISGSLDKLKELFDDIGSEISDIGQVWQGPGQISGIGSIIENIPNVGDPIFQHHTPVVEIPWINPGESAGQQVSGIVDSISDTVTNIIDNIPNVVHDSVNTVFDTVQNVADKINDIIDPTPDISFPHMNHWDTITAPDGTEIAIMMKSITICNIGDIQL